MEAFALPRVLGFTAWEYVLDIRAEVTPSVVMTAMLLHCIEQLRGEEKVR